MYSPVKNICFPHSLPISIYQVNRCTQRIHFIFSFPDIGAHIRQIMSIAVTVRRFIECICIRIGKDHPGLSANDSFYNCLQLCILTRIPDIMHDLCGGIPQPHGRDISGYDKIVISGFFYCSLYCIQEAVFYQGRRLLVMLLIIRLQLFRFPYQYLGCLHIIIPSFFHIF